MKINNYIVILCPLHKFLDSLQSHKAGGIDFYSRENKQREGLNNFYHLIHQGCKPMNHDSRIYASNPMVPWLILGDMDHHQKIPMWANLYDLSPRLPFKNGFSGILQELITANM
jgi:hypothetical protein